MKVISFKALLLLVISTVVLSCNKQPTADFSTDKLEYTQGETVVCTNLSANGDSFVWILPEGQTNSSTNLNFMTSTSMTPGTYNISLKALSKNGKKTASVTKSFVLKQASGQLTVWTSRSNVGPITVKVNGTTYGTITLYYASSTPACGANGCVTVNLPVGRHTISATDGNSTWSGSTDVALNKCTAFQLK